MTIRMKSLRAFPYAGRRLQAGEEFDARGESDKRVLVAIKAATVAPRAAPPIEPPAVAPRARVRRTVEAPVDSTLNAGVVADAATPGQASAEALSEPEQAAPAKRHYRRRDMTAAE